MDSNSEKVMPFAPGCPWFESVQTYGVPNVKWCENTVCSIVNEPANAYSNFLFVFFAILIIIKNKANENKFSLYHGWMIFFMGLLSFVYHATNNFLTQIFDYLGMFLFIFWMLVQNLIRIKLISYKYRWPIFSILVIFSTSIIPFLYKIRFHYQALIFLFSLTIVLTELYLKIKTNQKETYNFKYNYIFIALFFFILGAFSSFSDVSRIWCEPDNHIIQGHGLWHIFSAIAAYFSHLFYKQKGVGSYE